MSVFWTCHMVVTSGSQDWICMDKNTRVSYLKRNLTIEHIPYICIYLHIPSKSYVALYASLVTPLTRIYVHTGNNKILLSFPLKMYTRTLFLYFSHISSSRLFPSFSLRTQITTLQDYMPPSFVYFACIYTRQRIFMLDQWNKFA